MSSRRRGRAVEQYARASTSSPSGCTGLGNGTIQGFEHPTDSFQLVGPLPIHDSSLFAGEPTELNKRVSARSAAAHRARWCRSPPPTFRARSSRSSPRPRSICGARARGASCPRMSSPAAVDGGCQLLLEFAPGNSLADVARGLAYLHGRLLVHGDVKARNSISLLAWAVHSVSLLATARRRRCPPLRPCAYQRQPPSTMPSTSPDSLRYRG